MSGGARSVCDLRSIARSTGNLRRPRVQRNAPCSYPHQCMAQRIFKRVSRRQKKSVEKNSGPVLDSVGPHAYSQMASEECQAHADLFLISTISLTAAGGRRFPLMRGTGLPHTGAKGVELCFSAASIRTARQSAAVMNISMNTPCARLTPGARNVLGVEEV